MIGVCIRYFHNNYGGLLQAYSTVSMLEARGLEYELIRYEKEWTPVGILRALPRVLNSVLLNDKYEAFLKKMGRKKHPEFARNDAIRNAAFQEFKDTHFTRLSPVFKGYDRLCQGASRYSAVITGSDQLWSPAGLPTNFYNLKFVPDSIRKISIASSFGVRQIPGYQKSRTADYLKRIEYVSMRENRGAEIVKELTGRTVPTIVDPVFLFDKAGWEKLIPVKQEVQEPYIFAYFLGNDPAHRKAVQEAADALGCKIVALRHLDQYVADDERFGDFAPYDVAPDRFLNLLRGAAYVCTDSFHGACFSVIHSKKFIIFNRYADGSRHSKNSRIDTLCRNLGLEARRFSPQQSMARQLDQQIDYTAVHEKLNAMIADTRRYLDEALDGCQ